MSQTQTPTLPGARAWTAGPSMSRAARFTAFVRRFMRTSPLGTAAAGFLIVICLAAIFADFIAPYPPLDAHFSATRQPPSAQYWLGTDYLGRDILSRLIYGARVTLLVAITSVLLGDTVGFLWGVASGYIGGRFDMISQRILDVLLSFPGLILAILLMAALGAGLTTVIIAIAISRIPLSTRVIRSVVLSVKEASYIEAARSIGATSPGVMIRHVAPQCLAPLLVILSANIGTAIFAESALSFLGIGVPPPTPTWGNMLGGVLAEAFKPPWWMIVFPGLAITLTIMACNLFGDALRDVLDPRLKRRID
ncbi:MAG: ABC transporter permease [Chloroflexi bacterium]|nr:ABC transporter permease [Chloroflexota bacterium]